MSRYVHQHMSVIPVGADGRALVGQPERDRDVQSSDGDGSEGDWRGGGGGGRAGRHALQGVGRSGADDSHSSDGNHSGDGAVLRWSDAPLTQPRVPAGVGVHAGVAGYNRHRRPRSALPRALLSVPHGVATHAAVPARARESMGGRYREDSTGDGGVDSGGRGRGVVGSRKAWDAFRGVLGELATGAVVGEGQQTSRLRSGRARQAVGGSGSGGGGRGGGGLGGNARARAGRVAVRADRSRAVGGAVGGGRDRGARGREGDMMIGGQDAHSGCQACGNGDCSSPCMCHRETSAFVTQSRGVCGCGCVGVCGCGHASASACAGPPTAGQRRFLADMDKKLRASDGSSPCVGWSDPWAIRATTVHPCDPMPQLGLRATFFAKDRGCGGCSGGEKGVKSGDGDGAGWRGVGMGQVATGALGAETVVMDRPGSGVASQRTKGVVGGGRTQAWEGDSDSDSDSEVARNGASAGPWNDRSIQGVSPDPHHRLTQPPRQPPRQASPERPCQATPVPREGLEAGNRSAVWERELRGYPPGSRGSDGVRVYPPSPGRAAAALREAKRRNATATQAGLRVSGNAVLFKWRVIRCGLIGLVVLVSCDCGCVGDVAGGGRGWVCRREASLHPSFPIPLSSYHSYHYPLIPNPTQGPDAWDWARAASVLRLHLHARSVIAYMPAAVRKDPSGEVRLLSLHAPFTEVAVGVEMEARDGIAVALTPQGAMGLAPGRRLR